VNHRRDRREFVAGLCRSGAVLAASPWLTGIGLVAPRPLDAPRPGSTMTFKLPARSYSVVVHLATS